MDGSEPHGGTSQAQAMCPLCAHTMDEHRIDHSGRDAVLHCPVDHLPEPVDLRPLNELGMPRRD